MAARTQAEWEQAFWEKVDRKEEDECWLWQASTRGKPLRYGQQWGPRKSELFYAHRLAHQLATGERPGGMQVLHSCDVPLCCNPSHLRLGTQADNMADAVERGRLRGRAGERHPSCKLTDAQVAEIIRRYVPGAGTALAREFGVSRSYITALVRGERRRCR
jgi:hypothetical protein